MVIRWDIAMSAALMLLMGMAPMGAQNVAQVGRPAEAPPAGFAGQQYVDSRGCVFMRAGFSGNTVWVPRIGRDRKPMCDAVTPGEAAARLKAEQGARPVETRPVETVASAMEAGQRTGVFAPAVVPGMAARADKPVAVQPRAEGKAQPVWTQPMAMQPVVTRAVPAVPQAGASGCPASAPVLSYVALSNGGSLAVCTRGDGRAEGWFSPRFNAYVPARAWAGAVQAVPVQRVAGVLPQAQQGQVPQGFAEAWDDGRLNPNRGLGTAQGWANQAQVWSNTTPARTHQSVAMQKLRRGGQVVDPAVQQVSYAPRVAQPQAQWGGGIYVQVGSFANAGNAQKAAGRLAGMGLPVASAQSSKRGRLLTSVMAGPFGSQAEAAQALQMARGAGFSDAFLR